MSLPQRAVVTSGDGVRHLSPAYAAAFLGLLRAAETVDRRLDQELRSAHGIGLRAFEVLLHVGALSDSDSVGLGLLTDQAPLSQSRMSRLVAELVAQGCLVRRPDPADARGAVVSLTARGRALLRRSSETHLRGLEEHLFSRIGRADVAELARITAAVLGDEAPRTGRARRAHAARATGS